MHPSPVAAPLQQGPVAPRQPTAPGTGYCLFCRYRKPKQREEQGGKA